MKHEKKDQGGKRWNTPVPPRTSAPKKEILAERTFRLIRPGSDGHLGNFVLIDSGAAGQQRTFSVINSEAGGHSELIPFGSRWYCIVWSQVKAGKPGFPC